MASRIKISTSRDDAIGVVIITLSGRMDIHSLETFRFTIQEELNQKNYRIVLDMKEISFIISTYIGLILTFQKHVKKNGGDLKLTSLCEEVSNIFELMGITSLLKIYDKNYQALDDFKEESSQS